MRAMVGGGDIPSVPFLPGDPWDSYIHKANLSWTFACLKSSSFLSQTEGVFPPMGGASLAYTFIARSGPEDLLNYDSTASFTEEGWGGGSLAGHPRLIFS